MTITAQPALTEAQEAGRKIAIRRILITQAVSTTLIVAGFLLWGIKKGAPMPHLSLPAGLMLVGGYGLSIFGVYDFTQTLRALGIRTGKGRRSY
jgi:hypothetical protein